MVRLEIDNRESIKPIRLVSEDVVISIGLYRSTYSMRYAKSVVFFLRLPTTFLL